MSKERDGGREGEREIERERERERVRVAMVREERYGRRVVR